MSRIGKKPVSVPSGVEVKCEDNLVTVKGAKGTLSRQFSKELGIAVENGEVIVTRPTDDKEHRSLHGLTRTLIANMIEGVTNGYPRPHHRGCRLSCRKEGQGRRYEPGLFSPGYRHRK